MSERPFQMGRQILFIFLIFYFLQLARRKVPGSNQSAACLLISSLRGWKWMERDTQVAVAWLPVTERFLFSLREARTLLPRPPPPHRWSDVSTPRVAASEAMITRSGYHLTLLFHLFFSPSAQRVVYQPPLSSPWFPALVKQDAAKLAANVGAQWRLKHSPLRNFLHVESTRGGFWPFSVPGFRNLDFFHFFAVSA